jgi:hypothetical protein
VAVVVAMMMMMKTMRDAAMVTTQTYNSHPYTLPEVEKKDRKVFGPKKPLLYTQGLASLVSIDKSL